ncbi:helix-turn-helix domain-containing protein [Marinobacter vinifirmus]|uniref:Helix-turn-helix domain-containing protein n=1 Tax=Marinobacter vinifirmus TaxID=355591 RepID=A0A558B2P2_9GAMM|nr:helix-turn-helix domain-containing protein [Marinobacter vinifirmus]TVT30743.1 MAG: helix-turn-helix domain-containing protein [Marinobacter vinifirmus]
MEKQLLTAKPMPSNGEILRELQHIKRLVANQARQSKPILSVDECSELLGISVSYIYRLTSEKRIPHYKPCGKRVFFRKEEVIDWALSHRITPDSEITDRIRSNALKTRRC